MKNNQKGIAVLAVVFMVVLILGLLAFFAFTHENDTSLKNVVDRARNESNFIEHDAEGPLYENSPVEVGKRLTRGNCEGEGSAKLTHSPMNPEDIGYIVPYGSTVGGHVTPIDHMYFYPKEFDSAADTYEVYAQADGTIYYLDENKYFVEESAEVEGDYAIKFSQSCTHLISYSLLSSLSPKLKEALGGSAREGETYSKYVNIPVKAGELVGRIGGRTLDYAVLDTTKPLEGFISPEFYEVEREKMFTADPFGYYSEDLVNLLHSKNLRSEKPLGGKIDYDVKGKLRGNWFLEGTYGYAGVPPDTEDRRGYWKGHLAIYPDHIDPSSTIISIGDFEGESSQFTVLEDTDPAKIGVGDGLIKYTLAAFEYLAPDGNYWEGSSVVKNLKVAPNENFVAGCALFEMPEEQKLQAEFVSNRSCDDVDGFSSDARIYER